MHYVLYIYILNRYEAIRAVYNPILMTNHEKPVSDIVRLSASENFIRRFPENGYSRERA